VTVSTVVDGTEGEGSLAGSCEEHRKIILVLEIRIKELELLITKTKREEAERHLGEKNRLAANLQVSDSMSD